MQKDPEAAENDTGRPPNRLGSETSLYLRQHMYNPVDWHPWGEEALALAASEDKPLLVSIGYSACHWCHVMERESFEDPETAELMNRLFVPIKVDREERPDVDQIYMDTVVRMTGHGGWPLTAFCTPDGRPFYAGTYFPPEPRHGLPAFRDLLQRIHQVWTSERDQVESSAGQVIQALAQQPRGVAESLPGEATVLAGAASLMERADRQHGGFGPGPKFPTPSSLDLLLHALPLLPAEARAEVESFLALTARAMARRGCYDHLGGGFHRYCVDGEWAVPHFEKMLYDQGQLLRFYTEMWRRDGSDEWTWPIRETASWLAREMTGEEGAFFASQDADSEGEEGIFYVWKPEQVEAVLGAEAGAAFCRTYGVTSGGNFEGGTSVLWDRAEGPRAEHAADREALLRERSTRVPPATDEKRVAAWNGLAISGLAHAGSLLEWPDLVAQARTAADFVLEGMRDGEGRLLRVYAGGQARIPAFLDDVAGMLSACLDLVRADGSPRYLEAAIALAQDVATRFFDETESDLFLVPGDAQRLPHRPRSDSDGATPQSTGLATLGLLRVAALTGDETLRKRADQVIRTHAFVLERSPMALPTLLRAAHVASRGLSTAIVFGTADDPTTRALAHRARCVLAPEDAVLLVDPVAGPPPGIDPDLVRGRDAVDGRATAYVCRGVTCSLPVTDPASLVPLESA
ncbi:MAG: thioredoxin domain-containing protein [Myxococcota bacterium]|nr:thioredoxin domain-containing protein [Myxococcota bacterium]